MGYLCGCLIDRFGINYDLTEAAFKKLGARNFGEICSQNQQSGLFDDFEIGKINAEKFREGLKAKLALEISDNEFDQAWNALLLDLPEEKLEFIRGLRNKYRTFLFSNTNSIHFEEIMVICARDTGHKIFEGCFEREYYSHLCGFRKPDKESFKRIIDENHLDPKQTLFVDDTEQHVRGAEDAGIHSFHLTQGKTLLDLEKIIAAINKNDSLQQQSTEVTASC